MAEKDIRTEKKNGTKGQQSWTSTAENGGGFGKFEAAAVFHIPQERNLFRPAALTAES